MSIVPTKVDEQGRPLCLHQKCLEPAVALVQFSGCHKATERCFTAGVYCIDHLASGAEFCGNTFLDMAGLKIPETAEEHDIHQQTAHIREQILAASDPDDDWNAHEGKEAA